MPLCLSAATTERLSLTNDLQSFLVLWLDATVLPERRIKSQSAGCSKQSVDTADD